MTTPAKPTCATCAFWEADAEPINGIHYGDCRITAKVGLGWPRTRREDWCGDHPDFQPVVTGGTHIPTVLLPSSD